MNPDEDPLKGLDERAEALVKAGVARACLLCSERFGRYSHEQQLAWAQRYPELFVPVAMIDPETTTRHRVWELYQMGYRGLKIIGVKRDYDTRDYWPMYEAAQTLDMPILFHMGVIGGGVDYSRTHPRRDPEAARRLAMFASRRFARDVSATRMHPFHLDTLANNLPTLKMIGAHLGGTGNYDAMASVARWRPNVYVDMSGGETIEEHGERRGYIAQDIGVEKLVWGSDCATDQIQVHIDRFEAIFERLKLTADQVDRMWFQNAAEMYGEATPVVAAE